MEEESLFVNELLKLAINLQSFCEGSDDTEVNKNILSVKFKILFLIHEYGDVSPSTLVSDLNIAKSNIALFCRQLANDGFIVSKHDEFDHRIIYYCLTGKGQDYVSNLLLLLDKHVSQTFEVKKQGTFIKHVKAINDKLEKLGAMKDVKTL